MRTCHIALLWAASAVSLSGCKGQPSEKFVTVEGRLMVEGQPVTTGHIGFIPDESRGNMHPEYSIGDIQPDGKFKLVTNDKGGVRLGWYKVVIWAASEPISPTPTFGANGQPTPINWVVATKYTTKETTDLFVEVVEQPSPGRYDFNVTK